VALSRSLSLESRFWFRTKVGSIVLICPSKAPLGGSGGHGEGHHLRLRPAGCREAMPESVQGRRKSPTPNVPVTDGHPPVKLRFQAERTELYAQGETPTLPGDRAANEA